MKHHPTSPCLVCGVVYANHRGLRNFIRGLLGMNCGRFT